MKSIRTLQALLCALIMLSLAACGSARGCEGRYICTDSAALLNGVSVDEEWIELDAGGRGTLHLMGKDYAIGWTLEGDELTLTQNGAAYGGFLSGGVMTVSYGELIYTYVKEGSQATAEDGEPAHSKLNALQRWWNGDWYGWWIIHDATGDWSELNGSWYDCCARLEFDAVGRGGISIWDAGGALCQAELKLSTVDAGGRMGAAHTVEGFFWSWRIGEDDWVLDPALSDYDNYLSVSGGYYEDDGGSFRYDVVLRPWGQLWDDVARQDASALPGGYYEWYLPLVEAGETMPATLDS